MGEQKTLEIKERCSNQPIHTRSEPLCSADLFIVKRISLALDNFRTIEKPLFDREKVVDQCEIWNKFIFKRFRSKKVKNFLKIGLNFVSSAIQSCSTNQNDRQSFANIVVQLVSACDVRLCEKSCVYRIT